MTEDQKRILALEKELAIANEEVANLSAIYQQTNEAIISHNNGIVISVNKAFLDMFGYERDEIIGQDLVQLIALDKYHKDVFKRFRSEGNSKPIFVECKKKDGTVLPFEATDRDIVIDDRKFMLTSFKDMTELVRKETKIKSLRSSFSAIFNNEEFPVAIIDAKEDKYLDVNDKGCEVLGYTKDEFLRLRPSQFSMESEHKTDRILERKSGRYLRALKTKSGEIKYASLYMCYSAQDGDELYYSIFSDITTEVNQREIIRDKQLFLDNILLKSDISSWDFNSNTGSLVCSSNLYSILGIDENLRPMTTADMAENFHPDDRIYLSQFVHDFFYEKIDSFSVDVRMLNRSGEIHWMRVVSIDLIRDEKGRPYRIQGLYIDINKYKEEERKLKLSEEQFSLLFMNINAGFSLHKMIKNDNNEIIDSQCILANKMFESILNLQGADVIGNFLSIAFPELLDEWLSVFRKIEASGEPISMVRYYSESDKHLEINIYSPQQNQMALLVTDITQRIKQEEKIIENQHFLKAQSTELQMKNEELELVSFEVLEGRATVSNAIRNEDNFKRKNINLDNRLYGRWEYDIEKDTFIGTDGVHEMFSYQNKDQQLSLEMFLELINPVDVDSVKRELYSCISLGTVCKQEYSIVVDGVAKTLLSQGIPQLNERGQVYKFVGIVLDITDRKKLEESLMRQRDHFLLLNEELIIAKEKMQESDKLKTAFFANMSHEIRTPMNGILGFSGLLMAPDVQDAERIEYSQIIVDAGNRLLTIVNDILDISKIQSDTVEIIKTDMKLNKLLTDLFRLFNQDKKIKKEMVKLILEKGLSDEDSIFITDENRFSQVFSNLISNALKFTQHGEVTMGYKLQNENLLFYVKDTGVGIPLDMQSKIFEPFRQDDNKLVRQYGGTGLGLSISKKLCRLMGGEMNLESVVGEGSIFTFSLPYERNIPRQRLMPKTQSKNELLSSAKKLCVLIAEDEEVNFLFFKSFLGKKTNLLRAENGVEAVEMVEQHPEIDIVLMDIKMPLMDGLEATRRIKKKHPNLLIIAQTAYAMNEDRDLSLEAGCDNHITKPINRRKLLEMINSYF